MPSAAAPRTLGDGLPAKLGNGPRAGYDLARVGSGLGRGPGMYKKLNGAPWSETFPALGATLDLDFANDRGFVRGVGQGRSMQAVTFTRASSGNYVGSDGLLRTAAGSFNGTANALGVNLLTFPQDFDNAAWEKLNTSIVANTEIAPDGTLTAERVTETIDNGTHRVFQQINFVANETYTASFFIKKGTRQWVWCALRTNAAPAAQTIQWFDLDNTAVGSSVQLGTQTTKVSASITDVGNGWKRCVLTIAFGGTVTTGANSGVYIGLANADGTTSYAGTVNDYNFIWGAQLEVGSTATDYYPTNINVPRFDWASTAQIQRFQNYAGIISAVNLNTVIRGFRVDSAVLPANTQVTVSFYIKRNSATSAGNIQINNDRTVWADSVTQPFNPSSITQGVWFRVVRTVTTTNEGQVGQLDIEGLTRSGFTPTATDNYGIAPNGLQESVRITDGAVDLELWGVQIELGGTATDYAFTFTGGVITNTPLVANPTCNGLLIEESRANRILWNRDGTNAAWVKTNVTATKDQTGIDGVASAATKLAATADNGTCIQTITLASGSRTGSVFLKRITGTGNVQVSLDGSTWSTVDLSSTEWRRIVLSGTVTNPTVGIRLATNGDEVAMDYAQVEDGAFATSPILTTTASVTRSADVPTISLNNLVPTNYLGITYYAAGTRDLSSGFGTLFLLGASTTYFRFNANTTVDSVASSAVRSVTKVQGLNKVALSLTSSLYSFSANGNVATNFNGAITQPFPMTTTAITLGQRSSTLEVLNGTLSRFTIIQKYTSPNGLQEMTN